MTIIKASLFVTRQTSNSKFSHFKGSWQELEALVLEHFDQAQPGYRDGVLIVPVPSEKFMSALIAVDSTTKLEASFEARRPNEAPFIQVVASEGHKLQAKFVELVLYSHNVLAENNEQSCEADWEIISINARSTEEPEPLHPVTMARNFLQLAGGTKGDFSAEDFAKSILFHAQHCLLKA